MRGRRYNVAPILRDPCQLPQALYRMERRVEKGGKEDVAEDFNGYLDDWYLPVSLVVKFGGSQVALPPVLERGCVMLSSQLTGLGVRFAYEGLACHFDEFGEPRFLVVRVIRSLGLARKQW